MFNLQGSINVLDPSNNSYARAIVVGAVVEQVYSSTFKFSVLKNTRNMSPETLHFTCKYTKK